MELSPTSTTTSILHTIQSLFPPPIFLLNHPITIFFRLNLFGPIDPKPTTIHKFSINCPHSLKINGMILILNHLFMFSDGPPGWITTGSHYKITK